MLQVRHNVIKKYILTITEMEILPKATNWEITDLNLRDILIRDMTHTKNIPFSAKVQEITRNSNHSL